MPASHIIGFWGPTHDYGYFSQWYSSPFTVDDIKYANAEQYMMAQKAKLFGDMEMFELLIQTPDPRKCQSLGRKIKNFDEKAWEKNRELIVYAGSLAKYTQNKDLQEKLLATGKSTLVEASPVDKIWGIGMKVTHPHFSNPEKWKGLNLLGNTLMKVREYLKQATTNA